MYFIRQIDDLGRIVIPEELRREMNKGNDDMEGIKCIVEETSDLKGKVGITIFIAEDQSIEC